MLNEATFFSPAKINLFLHLVKKRADGYHELVSLMQALDFFDTLHIKISSFDVLSCNDSTIPLDDKNLIWKATNLFWAAVGFKKCVSFHLTKRIPVGAGLGGGSSNAATTLFGLNKLLGNPLSKDQLITLAGQIGSDVAFFLSSGTAICSGRGEKIEDIKLEKRSICLAIPELNISTKEVYSLSSPEDFKNRDLKTILCQYKQGDLILFNDLETLAIKVEPKLQIFKEKLERLGFDKVSMTGSGSAFICLGEEPKHSAEIIKTSFINRESEFWYGQI